MHGFDLTIGITAPTLQLIILALLFRRRLVDRFPLFCAYTSYSILASVARLWIIDRPRPFFVLYWTTEIVYGFLSLLAVYEVFKSEGSMRCATRGWLGVLPQITFAVVTGTALWRAAYRPMGYSGMARLAAGAYAFMPGILFLEVVLFFLCLYLGFKKRNRLTWGRYRGGILAGFGLAACASVVADVFRGNFGPSFESFFRYVPAASYIGATVVWLITFYRNEISSLTRRRDPEAWKRAAQSMSKAADRAERDWRKLRFGEAGS